MDKAFYWIGVGTVAISTLAVFSLLVFSLIGWLFSRAGIRKYADIGESILWATILKGGDIVFDKQPDKPAGSDSGN